jgi:hypothetical protein
MPVCDRCDCEDVIIGGLCAVCWAAPASPVEPAVGLHLAAALAYGLLWHMEIDRNKHNLRLASDARKALLHALTADDRKRGIELAKMLNAQSASLTIGVQT